ncbi:hypothetical protein SAMN02745165_01358 [Malonomonas rubra DSM 5091]|uniref:RWP-RK domain-containing protein n=1 Tax=Malonomonas rubra DSM 5091 TaxID=1122189 RepID=A0A1M6FP32_MALRU|nr:hypothetical protein [Malonomonas rubra]SHI99440.1 hypothetical protein SAMN02745165_01358 [Malonomonas rubra DSM 5091]
MPPKIIILSRKELHQLVWSMPMKDLAPDFGMTDSGLRKKCRKYDIPIPHQGYWLRKNKGKPAKLTESKFTENARIEFRISENNPPVSDDISEKMIEESDSKHKITIKQKLRNPHPLIQKARDLAQKRPRDKYGRLRLADDCSVSLPVLQASPVVYGF